MRKIVVGIGLGALALGLGVGAVLFWELLKRSPADGLSVSHLEWKKEIFETVIVVGFIVRNDRNKHVKDVVISCETVGPSGTTIRSVRHTIYQQVLARNVVEVKRLSLGAADQVASVRCAPVSASVL